MGASSNSEKSMRALASAPYDSFVFRAFKSTLGGITLNVDRSGSVPNEAYMGIAAASYWLIGGNPSRSSIDRTIELVEYIVLSTVPRLTYGLITRPVVRLAST